MLCNIMILQLPIAWFQLESQLLPKIKRDKAELRSPPAFSLPGAGLAIIASSPYFVSPTKS